MLPITWKNCSLANVIYSSPSQLTPVRPRHPTPFCPLIKITGGKIRSAHIAEISGAKMCTARIIAVSSLRGRGTGFARGAMGAAG